MLKEVGAVDVEVTVGELMGEGACVIFLEACEAVAVELEVDGEDLFLLFFLLVVALPSLCDRL